jgi:hypothetical protein
VLFANDLFLRARSGGFQSLVQIRSDPAAGWLVLCLGAAMPLAPPGGALRPAGGAGPSWVLGGGHSGDALWHRGLGSGSGLGLGLGLGIGGGNGPAAGALIGLTSSFLLVGLVAGWWLGGSVAGGRVLISAHSASLQ